MNHDTKTQIQTISRHAELMAAWTTGERVEIDKDTFEYFLDILPPYRMGHAVMLSDGSYRSVAFEFAEGAGIITAFWKERKYNADGSKQPWQYYLQHTMERSRG